MVHILHCTPRHNQAFPYEKCSLVQPVHFFEQSGGASNRDRQPRRYEGSGLKVGKNGFSDHSQRLFFHAYSRMSGSSHTRCATSHVPMG